MTPVEQAIAAAQAAAQATAAINQAPAGNAVDNAVALASASQNGVSTSVTSATPAAKLTMDDVTGSTMSVDLWLKPKEDGLMVGDRPEKFQNLPVVIDMTAYIVKYGIKNGNPAQYAYTTDLATCVTGGTWAAAEARIRALNPATASSSYRAVDIPMEVPSDFSIKVIDGDKVKEVVLIEAGKMLGYTTSTTNWKAWELFYKSVCDAGLQKEKVLVHVGSEKRQNKNGQIWGTMTFKLIGSAAEELSGGE